MGRRLLNELTDHDIVVQRRGVSIVCHWPGRKSFQRVSTLKPVPVGINPPIFPMKPPLAQSLLTGRVRMAPQSTCCQ